MQQEVNIHRTICISWVNPDLEKRQNAERSEDSLVVFLTSLKHSLGWNYFIIHKIGLSKLPYEIRTYFAQIKSSVTKVAITVF